MSRLRRLRRLRLGRLPVLGLSAVLLLGGGTGLVVASTLSSGSAGADSTLGGFTVTALAEASTAQYEQPNFPLPATPSAEFDEGYASTSDNYGPSGSAVASTLYPGQVVANAGPELALLVPGVPLPPAPIWPIEAVSAYPQTPNTASTDQPGVNMDATSTGDVNTATASIGDNSPAAGASSTTTTTAPTTPGLPAVTGLTGGLGGLGGTTTTTTTPGSPAATTGSGNPLGSASSIIGIAFSSGTSSSGASGATAVATATATDSGISILGGLINIGSVTSTANATSDGTTGTVAGSTVLGNVSIAGQPVTINSSGIQADGESTPATSVVATLNTILTELGITMTVTNPTDTVQGPSAARTLDGLKITINLNTLDAAADKFSSLLPGSLTSQLPVALPDESLLTYDLGTVTVSSTASPPFDAPAFSAPTATAAPVAPSSGSGLGSSDLSSSGGSSLGGGSTTPLASSAPTSAPVSTGQPTSAVTPLFKGIGSGLILLGLLAAGAMAFAYKRADDASELLGTACADGDPLFERFSPAGDGIDDVGGFT
jgi:hypothetical protein